MEINRIGHDALLITIEISADVTPEYLPHQRLPAKDRALLLGVSPTPLALDLPSDIAASHLDEILEDCLERGLFTVEEAWLRLDEPDRLGLRGADLLRRALPP
jgi:hypothetical protein